MDEYIPPCTSPPKQTGRCGANTPSEVEPSRQHCSHITFSYSTSRKYFYPLTKIELLQYLIQIPPVYRICLGKKFTEIEGSNNKWKSRIFVLCHLHFHTVKPHHFFQFNIKLQLFAVLRRTSLTRLTISELRSNPPVPSKPCTI